MAKRKNLDPQERQERLARGRQLKEGEALYEPTPEALAADTAKVRATWNEATALSRLRYDWRPVPAELVETSIEHGAVDEQRWHDRAFSRAGGPDSL